MDSFISLIGIIVFSGIGMWFFLPCLQGFIYGGKSKNWPTISGVIVESGVKEYKGFHMRTQYAAIVKYSYCLDGRNYIGDCIGFCKKGSIYNHSRYDNEEANFIANQHPKGEEVKVFYNPDNFKVSVLYPGYSRSCFELLLYSIISFSVAFYAIFNI